MSQVAIWSESDGNGVSNYKYRAEGTAFVASNSVVGSNLPGNLKAVTIFVIDDEDGEATIVSLDQYFEGATATTAFEVARARKDGSGAEPGTVAKFNWVAFSDI